MPGKFSQTVGSRAQVWHGTAKHTSGGLEKKDLMKNKNDRIVSRAKHNSAKKEMRLVKYGYGTKKGKFGFVKVGSKSRKGRRGSRSRKGRRGSRNMRGGMNLSPANVGDNYMLRDVDDMSPETPLNRALVGGRKRRGSRKYKGGTGKSSLNPMTLTGPTAEALIA